MKVYNSLLSQLSSAKDDGSGVQRITFSLLHSKPGILNLSNPEEYSNLAGEKRITITSNNSCLQCWRWVRRKKQLRRRKKTEPKSWPKVEDFSLNSWVEQ